MMSLCIRNLETVAHLLMECPFTRAIWACISDWAWASLPCLHPQNWKADWRVVEWFNELLCALPPPKSKGAKSLIILVC
jgi:hypothetical protein